ncbi:MAG: hypothetical protein JKY37_20525 [Nannocystaceae bacterium]|nr:hypothetical protein [Nannocystaceae bacterium]
MRDLSPTALAATIAVTLATTSVTAHATAAEHARAQVEPASIAPDEVAPEDAAVQSAKAKYNEGRAKFETADYSGAIELWTQAYSSVPDNQSAARIKALLIFNIATAHERVYDVTKDLSQLRRARILLVDFAPSLPQLYTDDLLQTETARVNERIADIDTQIKAAEDLARPPGERGPQPAPTDPSQDEPSAAGRGLVIGGAVTLALGAAGLGIMGAGLAIGSGANDLTDPAQDDIDGRGDQFDRGRTGNSLAIAGAVVGGVGVLTGAVLIGLGLTRKRKLAWNTGPGLVGVGLRGQF